MIKKILLTGCVLVILLAGCSGVKAPGSTEIKAEPNQPAVTNTVSEKNASGYPAPDENGAETAYPVEQPTPKKVVIITDTPDVLRSPMIISNVIKTGDEEKIIIKNVTQQDQEITLFAILEVSSGENFHFPDYKLAPGATVMVYNGPGEINQKEGFKWMDHPLLAAQGDQYVLLNRAGRLIWTYVYYPQ
jgi:hypothetical protein